MIKFRKLVANGQLRDQNIKNEFTIFFCTLKIQFYLKFHENSIKFLCFVSFLIGFDQRSGVQHPSSGQNTQHILICNFSTVLVQEYFLLLRQISKHVLLSGLPTFKVSKISDFLKFKKK